MSNHNLRRWYRRLNHNQFAGKLPELGRKVRFKTMSDLGSTMYKRSGAVKGIRINVKLQFSEAISVATLVHEMVHTAHPTWQCRTQKFARLVARILLAEYPAAL